MRTTHTGHASLHCNAHAPFPSAALQVPQRHHWTIPHCTLSCISPTHSSCGHTHLKCSHTHTCYHYPYQTLHIVTFLFVLIKLIPLLPLTLCVAVNKDLWVSVLCVVCYLYMLPFSVVKYYSSLTSYLCLCTVLTLQQFGLIM